jgi:hypothetical protein
VGPSGPGLAPYACQPGRKKRGRRRPPYAHKAREAQPHPSVHIQPAEGRLVHLQQPVNQRPLQSALGNHISSLPWAARCTCRAPHSQSIRGHWVQHCANVFPACPGPPMLDLTDTPWAARQRAAKCTVPGKLSCNCDHSVRIASGKRALFPVVCLPGSAAIGVKLYGTPCSKPLGCCYDLGNRQGYSTALHTWPGRRAAATAGKPSPSQPSSALKPPPAPPQAAPSTPAPQFSRGSPGWLPLTGESVRSAPLISQTSPGSNHTSGTSSVR